MTNTLTFYRSRTWSIERGCDFSHHRASEEAVITKKNMKEGRK